MNTREHDIQHIESNMAKGLISRAKGRALIDKLHRQTKDHTLEEKGKKLIEDQKKYYDDYQMVRKNPEKLHPEKLKQVIKHFQNNPHEF